MKSSPFRLVSLFTKPVPENDLPPLSEMLGNIIQQSLVKFPRTGDAKKKKLEILRLLLFQVFNSFSMQVPFGRL